VWFHFLVQNKGTEDAKDFAFKRVIRNNGSKIYDPPAETLNLAKNTSKQFSVSITVGAVTNDVEAKILFDLGNRVTETNEKNNQCAFTLTARTVH
jgi:hypothetical protein